MRVWHRFGAGVLGVFLLLHLGNHLLLFVGFEAHRAVMHSLRQLYRWPPLEAVLLLAVCTQLMSGVMLAWRSRRGCLPALRWQRWSGLALLLFLLIHVSAVLLGRRAGLDTDVHFAAAGLHHHPAWLFFAPYYTLAVGALGLHLGARLARCWPQQAGRCLWGGAMLGLLLGASWVMAMAGWLYPVTIPAVYHAAFR